MTAGGSPGPVSRSDNDRATGDWDNHGVSPRTQISLCGQFALTRDGEDLGERLPGRQGRALLAFLALNRDRLVTREELVDVAWPEGAPASADSSLRVLLSRLRATLGKGAIVGRQELRLELGETVEIDLERAVEDLRCARLALGAGDPGLAVENARRGTATLAQPLLSGLDAPWLDERRRTVEDLTADGYEVLAEASLQLVPPDLATAEQAARAIVAAQPFRETGYLCLMQALSAGGNVSEALRVHEQIRVLLRDEIGASPSARLQALHADLLAGRGAVAAPAPAMAKRSVPLPLPFVLEPMARTPLLGREEELATLQRKLDEVRGDRVALMLLTGEPGIGKTRLCAAFAARAHAAGASVLYGRCDEEALIPGQPFVEALRALVLALPEAVLAEALSVGGPELARLLPEVRERLPSLPAQTGGDAEHDRYWLLESVVSLLARSAREHPVVLFLDDLHWADRLTLLALRQLGRAPNACALLVVGTSRVGELTPGHPLVDTLGDLRRTRAVDRVRLRGLGDRSVGELIAGISGVVPTDAYARAVREFTAGNPLWVEETARLALERRGPGVDPVELDIDPEGEERVDLARGVKDLIAQRIAGLPGETRQLLVLAAVIGVNFTLPVLARVAESDEEEALDRLEPAIAQQLVREDVRADDRFTFAHAAVREALREQLSRPRRGALHAQVAAALEKATSDDVEPPLAQLAYHYLRAEPEQLDLALEYSRRAAERAIELLAFEESAGHYEAALDALKRIEERTARKRCDLLTVLGDANARAQRVDAAQSAFDRAAETARSLGDIERFAHSALGRVARFRWGGVGEVDQSTIPMLEEALDGLPEHDSRERALLLSRLATELSYGQDTARRLDLSHLAVETARRLGDDDALGEALTARHYALLEPQHLEHRLVAGEEILALARKLDDGLLEMQGRICRVGDLLETGDVRVVDQELDACAELAEREQLPVLRWAETNLRALRVLHGGDLVEAETLTLRAAEQGGETPAVKNSTQAFAARMFVLRWEQRRLHEMEHLFHEMVARHPAMPVWRCGLAVLYAELGRDEEAHAEIDRVAANDFVDLPFDSLWLGSLTAIALALGEMGDLQHARRVHALILPYADRNVVVGFPSVSFGPAARYLGLLAAAWGDLELAEVHFGRAIELCDRMAAPTWRAHSERGLAEALLARGQHDRARELLARAGAAASELGMVALEAKVARLGALA